jgi:hypothetical protein
LQPILIFKSAVVSPPLSATQHLLRLPLRLPLPLPLLHLLVAAAVAAADVAAAVVAADVADVVGRTDIKYVREPVKMAPFFI